MFIYLLIAFIIFCVWCICSFIKIFRINDCFKIPVASINYAKIIVYSLLWPGIIILFILGAIALYITKNKKRR